MELEQMNEEQVRIAQNTAFNATYMVFSMNHQRVLLAFGGVSCNNLNTVILESIEQRLLQFGDRKKVVKRVINVLIECLGNLANHSYKTGDVGDNSAITVTQTKTHYVIHSSNRIKQDEQRLLAKRLEDVNKLNAEELKTRYIEVLSKDTQSAKGGAGLGIIDMCKKSSENKLRYQFYPLNDGHNIFSLQVRIQRFFQNETV